MAHRTITNCKYAQSIRSMIKWLNNPMFNGINLVLIFSVFSVAVTIMLGFVKQTK